MSKQSKQPLSDLENKVMDAAWAAGSVTADQVRMALEPEQSLKDSTIRTVLRRLEEKGYVTHVVEGRTYIYTPTGGAQAVAADAVRGIIDRFCKGSVEDLLLGLIDREVVSHEELSRLAQRIAKSKENTPETKPTRKKRN
ncbi:MAG: CopY family transcriptional regulator [Blastopirellula sp.]|nr:MAG: CopY family transcriptional regulator [Blastopirellula sp.]